MYNHHSQQRGPQTFSDGSRPHHEPHPNQHQHHTPSEMLAQGMGFKFPRPTQLPDELESALALRGARDMDHRLIDQMSPSNQHHNPRSISGISQHGTYCSTSHSADNQSGHKKGVDWTSYQPPTKLFASSSPRSSHQSQQHQGPQQQPESRKTGTNIPGWTATVSDSQSPQGSHLQSGGGGDSQCFYTPESAGSILASFGLSNEDLEVLSHYPDDQLNPDTLPFILRDIQINKSGKQKTVTSTSSSLFSHSIHDMPVQSSHSLPLTNSRSSEVPSLLAVTQTAGKVIDYGHASRTKGESTTRETFKREPLSSERTVNLYPPLSSSSSLSPKADEAERRRIHTENTEPSKHGDRDYRASTDHHKSSQSAGTEMAQSLKTRNLDRDYRHEGPKPRPSTNSSGSKPHSNSSRKLPTPTMISDFSAVSPKVYPHTCSLCHIQCDQEKDWVEHINTVNHTAACRDLRNKYPDWKPKLPSRSGRYGSRALWDPKDGSPSHSVARSLSCSPTPRLTRKKHGLDPHPYRPHGKLYSLHHHPRYHHNSGHRLEHHQSSSHRTSSSSREHRPEKRDKELSGASPGIFSQGALKRPTSDSTQHTSSSKAGHISKHAPSQSNRKSGTKTGAVLQSTKPPPTKKKKKTVTPVSQDLSVVNRLIYLTGIPNDSSEQEVTDLVRSFGKINNVILLTCSLEESERAEGQKASVCMEKAEDANALANSTSLSIRDQPITALKAKKPEERQSCDVSNSKIASGDETCAVGESSGCEADQKTSDEKGMVLITGLPENNWSESDIIKLIQPFGTPSDIILATQIGKVLVSVPDMEIAEEIVKVHTFIPAKINESDLKIVPVKQRIGFGTPVALYNLLMGSMDPLENPVPVGWSSLLVIRNVPNTPSSSSEVQKLVQRFGTVIKTLVLNSMVICEMATAAMALSVYKRFQMFPCIIHNNPLFFSRKPDPKANTQAKVITAYMESSEHRLDVTANGKNRQTAAAANKKELTQKEKSECLLEVMEEDVAGVDEKMKNTEKTFGEEETFEANKSKDEIQKDKLASAVSILDIKMSETSAVKVAVETAEENELPDASKAGNDKSPADKAAEPSSSDDKTACRKLVIPDLRKKVTHAMVNALLVECRTRTSSHPTNIIVSTGGEQDKTQSVTEHCEKAAEETNEPTKNFTEEEMPKERQDRERKEREVRKKEERERVRKERDRRSWGREEKFKKDREWDERGRRQRENEKREWERKERERTRGKRSLSEDLSGSRSFSRSEGYKQSSMRDVPSHKSEAKCRVVEQEEGGEEFPFNISDFVTVDEVGDVTDLLCSPQVVPMETTEGGEDAPTSVHKDTTEEAPMEVVTEKTSTVTLVDSNKPNEAEPMTVSTTQSPDSLVMSRLTPVVVLTMIPSSKLPASHVDLSLNQKDVVTCQIDAAESETLISEVEQLTTPAPAAAGNQHESTLKESSSDSQEARPATVESEEKKKEDSTLTHSQAKEEEEVVIVMVDQQEKKHKQMGATAAEIGKTDSSEKHIHTQEDSVKKTVQTKTPPDTDGSLPPFDPSNPVGMEFLVPKTGFFCKVCNRFFSGTKEMEISHCKTIKHYENLQKYLQTTTTANVTA